MWKSLPATEDVIQRVNHLAMEQKQLAVDCNFKYEFSGGGVVDHDSDEEESDNEMNKKSENQYENINSSLQNNSENEVMTVNEIITDQDDEIYDGNNAETLLDQTETPVEEEENEEIDQPVDVYEIEREEVSVHLPDDAWEMDDDQGATMTIVDEPEGVEEATTSDELVDTQESDISSDQTGTGMILRKRPTVDYASLHKRGVAHMQVKGAKQFVKKVKRINKELKKRYIIVKDMFKKVVAITMMAQIKSASKYK